MSDLPRKGFPRALKALYDFLDGKIDTYDAAIDGATEGHGAGAAAGSGVVAVESGTDVIRKTVLTFTNVHLAMVDNAGVGAHAGLKVYDMPEGNIYTLGATADFVVTKSTAGVNADFDGDFGVGTVVADTGATLATTEQNIIPTTATPQAVAGATTAKGVSTAALAVDGSGTAMDVYLNVLVDDADQDVTTTPCDLIFNGTLTIVWTNIGDK